MQAKDAPIGEPLRKSGAPWGGTTCKNSNSCSLVLPSDPVANVATFLALSIATRLWLKRPITFRSWRIFSSAALYFGTPNMPVESGSKALVRVRVRV